MTSFFSKFSGYKSSFWILNFLQMLEIFAYQNIVLQMSIYIAQKDVPGGLQWDHTLKGIIFFVWALAQRLVPLIAGYFSDRFGYKITMLTSFVLVFLGYWVLGTQRVFEPFLIGAVILGVGSGLFKPSLQGAMSHSLGKSNHTFGWSIYFMLFNLAVLMAIPFSNFIKTYGWNYIFLASAAVALLNFLCIFFLYDEKRIFIKEERMTDKIHYWKKLFRPQVILFLIIMSGFTIIYMQFYETLPNFIYDWVDTSAIVSALSIPRAFLIDTQLGTMISYEWLYALNTIMIVALVSVFGWMMRNQMPLKSLTIGICFSTVGLVFCGNSYNGLYFIIGIAIYTLGEMITNPNFTAYIESLAGENDRGTHLSFLNISFAIGLGGGSLLGGWLYNNFGERAALASRYLNDKFALDISPKTSLQYMRNNFEMTEMQIRNLLWDTYHPYAIWYIFLCVGFISAIALYFYYRKYGKAPKKEA